MSGKDRDHDPAASLQTAKQLHIEADVSLLKEAHDQEPEAVAIGTRASALALAQAYLIQAALASVKPSHHFHVSPMSTAGDKNQSTALYLLGGKSYWTKELEVALLEGAIDLIVHSLKDVPTSLPDGLELGAITKREDPRDCLVVKQGLKYKSLKDLPDGSVVGTSSVRRVAQLRRAYPTLLFADVRGNINTRLAKLDAPDGPFAALILATAGLNRLHFDARITAYLEAPELYYAVGQGALGIEIRSKDPRIRDLVAQIDHWQTSWTCQAERELLRSLEGGCSVPVGCTTTLTDVEEKEDGSRSATMKLSGVIASLAGEKWIEATVTRRIASVQDALAAGADVAEDLVQKGGKEILAELGRKVEDDAFRLRHEDAVRRAMERVKQGNLDVQKGVHCGHPEELPLSPRFSKAQLPPVNAEELPLSPRFSKAQLPPVNGHS